MTETAGTALITGASMGVGAEYAQRLAERGHDLVLVARNGDRLADVAGKVSAATGRKVDVLVADLTIPAELELVEQRLKTDETITVLVNNAGGAGFGPVQSGDADAYDAVIDLNISALTRLTAAALPGFVRRDHGTVINISSALALNYLPVAAVYSATKSYVLTFSQILQLELAETAVRVQAVLPGGLRTELWSGSGIELSDLPDAMIMTVAEAVDAALVGLDAGELVTIPSLENVSQWDDLEAARAAISPNVSLAQVASRYAS
jgi:short-subunit dehydrogenase